MVLARFGYHGNASWEHSSELLVNWIGVCCHRNYHNWIACTCFDADKFDFSSSFINNAESTCSDTCGFQSIRLCDSDLHPSEKKNARAIKLCAISRNLDTAGSLWNVSHYFKCVSFCSLISNALPFADVVINFNWMFFVTKNLLAITLITSLLLTNWNWFQSNWKL